MSGPTVVWFRRDLRLSGNPAWREACVAEGPVLAVFVRDPVLLAAAGPFRRAAVAAAVETLAHHLDGGLRIEEGDPVEVVPRLVRDVGASAVSWNDDVSPYATRRDRAVTERVGVPIRRHWGSLVHPPGSIVTAAGTVPRVFGAFWRRWQARAVPLGADGPAPDPTAWAGLQAFFDSRLAGYETQREHPAGRGTSELSVALKLGTIGPAEVVVAAREHAARTGTDAEPFVRQLAWRDWFAHLLHERPELVEHAQRGEYDGIAWRDDEDDFTAWTEGRTGFPIVDAGMRELATTGRMHNRVRMIAASFLVKDLLVDWRRGERHFRHLLADGDVAQNVGNWQWVAGTGPDAAPYFRVLNPTRQSRTLDPGGEYLRRWLPELASLPDRAIHEPAALAPSELAATGVTLDVDYPAPIVDHRSARERAIAAYAAARDGALRGR